MPLKTHVDEQPTLNLTSLIDVLFLLIIFFMVSTRFASMERKINVQIPAVSDHGALSSAPEKRTVNVYRTGQITLDGDTVNLEQLTTKLTAARTQYKELGVMVRGDAQGAFQNVASVLS